MASIRFFSSNRYIKKKKEILEKYAFGFQLALFGNLSKFKFSPSQVQSFINLDYIDTNDIKILKNAKTEEIENFVIHLVIFKITDQVF